MKASAHMPQGRDAALESTTHLIARARAGDETAVDRLFARHHGPLRRWASGRLPKWARQLTDTDDLVQDALLQTFKRLEKFEPRGAGALQAYLRQAVMNRLRDELRRRGRQPPAVELDGGAADGLVPAGGESPLEQAIGRQNLERYERALATLKADEREAIIGRIEMGYTYQELAEAIGKTSAEAARKATERALVRLAVEMRRARQ
jgi:RNA polymerase sigma-70 factor, ECF subfamily